MQQVNVHDAETNFSQLLTLVEAGEEVVIARHGQPVARLLPIAKRAFQLGAGTGEFISRERLGDMSAFAPLSDQEADRWTAGL